MQYAVMMAVIGWVLAGYFGYRYYLVRKAVEKMVRSSLDMMMRIEDAEEKKMRSLMTAIDKRLN